MRSGYPVLALTVILAGCVKPKPPANATAGSGGIAPPMTVPLPPATNFGAQTTLSGRRKGRVALVDVEGHFVVLTFPIGGLPAIGTRLNVYRAGLKVGEVKVTAEQLENNTVADITAGECRQGDEARTD